MSCRKNHPARDMQVVVVRHRVSRRIRAAHQTSGGQIRVGADMESSIKVCAGGSPQKPLVPTRRDPPMRFTRWKALVVDKGITLATR